MHIPEHFKEDRLDVLHDLIGAHPFATFVTFGESGLNINHLPFVLDADASPKGTLRGHVSRGNPVWTDIRGDVEVAVVFQGPQTYISPGWYPSKRKHGKVVPTWNYAIVHATGTPQFIHDSAWLLNHLNQLTAQQEAEQAVPWKVSDAPEKYTEKMIQAIVGIELPISKLSGKWKMSQNRPRPDRLGVIAGLATESGRDAEQVAELVKQTL